MDIMDEAKKQKVMLAIIAVCVLGAGGAWFVFRDSGSEQTAATTRSSGQRKQRRVTATNDKKKRRTREVRQDSSGKKERRVREVSKSKRSKSTRRIGRTKARKTKKKVSPMATNHPRHFGRGDDWEIITSFERTSLFV